jgi:hypothetical protein
MLSYKNILAIPGPITISGDEAPLPLVKMKEGSNYNLKVS